MPDPLSLYRTGTVVHATSDVRSAQMFAERTGGTIVAGSIAVIIRGEIATTNDALFVIVRKDQP